MDGWWRIYSKRVEHHRTVRHSVQIAPRQARIAEESQNILVLQSVKVRYML